MDRRARGLITAVALSVLLFVTTARADTPEAFQSTARSTLFTEHWKFTNTDTAGADQPTFDDAAWRDVTLPHDWSAEGPFDEKWASGTAYLPGGVGWYRKSFTLPADLANRRISIRFDGVYKNSTVWCNGHALGTRPNGYIWFEYDLTPYVHLGGQPNVIAVRVDHHDFADSRWYPGSGIDRDVWLTVTDAIHVAPNGTYVTTPEMTSEAARLDVVTTIRNDAADADVSLLTTILDDRGGEVARASTDTSARAAAASELRQSLTLAHPQLWSVDHPYLYDVRTQVLRGGKVVDEYHAPLGVRSFRFDAQKGFSLNGVSMKLKGVCLHDDAGVLGAAVPTKVWEFRLKKLRDAGCNAIRTSHNPPPPELLDLCDRMGFLVMDEAFDEWTRGKKKWVAGTNKGAPSFDGYNKYFDRWAETDLRDMLLRDRNHPSIILWSVGNEIDYKNDPYPPNSPELPPVAAALIRVVKQFDPTRPVTAACASVPTNLFCDQLHVVGYNYQEPLYAADHAKYPHRVIYGSENALRAEAWQAVVDNEFVAGQFLWTGADYLGESGGWPGRGSPPGLLDLAGLEKSLYYFRQSLWTDKPMVHLRPSPNGFVCYTNCDAVELFEDGHSIGEQPSPAATRVIFWRSDRPGRVYKAVGKKAGATACEFVWKKPAGAAKLAMRTDSTALTADGRDVAVIEVTATDAEGNPVTTAGNAVTCTVDGPGRLLGMENGDMANHDTANTPSRKANRGRLVVYVQSTHTPGQIITHVTAVGLETGSVSVTSK